MSDEYCVFIDESGNAGDDLLAPQPVFALVAVIVAQESVQRLSDELRRLKVEFRFAPDQELKGARLLKTRNCGLMEKASRLILSEGLPIISCVVERRYMICALVIDELYDPEYNRAVDRASAADPESRQRLANHLYEYLKPETIRLAHSALVYGDRDDLAALCPSLRADMAGHSLLDGMDLLAVLAGYSRPIDELSREICEARSSGLGLGRSRPGVLKSPNLVSFLDIINRVEQLFEADENARVNLVFDSSSQFDECFAEWTEVLQQASPTRVTFANGRTWVSGFRSIRSFSTADSLSTPLLQCADYFAAGTRYAFDEGLRNERLNLAMKFYLGLSFMCWTRYEMLNPIASKALLARFWHKCADIAPGPPSD